MYINTGNSKDDYCIPVVHPHNPFKKEQKYF